MFAMNISSFFILFLSPGGDGGPPGVEQGAGRWNHGGKGGCWWRGGGGAMAAMAAMDLAPWLGSGCLNHVMCFFDDFCSYSLYSPSLVIVVCLVFFDFFGCCKTVMKYEDHQGPLCLNPIEPGQWCSGWVGDGTAWRCRGHVPANRGEEVKGCIIEHPKAKTVYKFDQILPSGNLT